MNLPYLKLTKLPATASRALAEHMGLLGLCQRALLVISMAVTEILI